MAPLLASRLGLSCVDLNELSVSHGLIRASAKDGGVDTGELRRIVAKEIPGRAVVFGHLIPFVLGRRSVSRVVVLRCEPGVLKVRLLKRMYPPRKLIDNVEAELIGLVSSEAYEAFGETKTFEIDTTYSAPARVTEAAIEIIEGTSAAPPRIDWTTNYSAAKLRLLLSTEAA